MSDRNSISTVHLGQFSRESADEIAGELERAGIYWWVKQPGYVSSLWEYGVRLFVDRSRLQEAKTIADAIVARRNPPGSA